MREFKSCNIYLLFLFLFFSCLQEKETDDVTLSFDNISIMSKGHILYDTPSNGWRLGNGDAKIDKIELYRNKASLLVSPDTLTSRSQVSFSLNTEEVEANKVIFSGKYKAESINGVEKALIFCITRLNEVNKFTTDSVVIHLTSKDTLWSDFYVTSLADKDDSKFIYFDIKSLSPISYRISDCKVSINDQPLAQIINIEYAAEKDTEFDDGSNILLGKLTPQKIKNLEVLGKVWGFLKYYHPQVTQGGYNWDYELFRVLPQITNAKDTKERNKLLNKWIDRYGKIKEIADYTITDSTQYSRIINLDWINNRGLFDEDLISKLNKIKNAKRNNKFNYYVVPHNERNFNEEIFKRERAYENIKWNDQGFRILTLFKLWNMIEYCFPYTDYTDISWNSLLKDFIPSFFHPESKSGYELSIKKLSACINDSHGYIHIPNNSLGETILAPIYKNKNRVPAELIQTKEGDIVIKSSETTYLERGDVIHSIEGRNVEYIIKEMRPYIIASNENGLKRNIMPYLLSSDKPELKVTILRKGKKKDLNIKDFTRMNSSQYIDYNLYNNIIYISTLYNPSAIDSVMQKKGKNINGIIIDLRKGALETSSLLSIAGYLFQGSVDNPLWISKNEKDYVGNYRFYPQNKINLLNSGSYIGKVAVLVDENVQSALETWAMLYSLVLQCKIVGTQTAGANGNVCTINLPGAIRFQYTQLGAYYPGWEVLQRKGVKIDIPVSSTVEDIVEGRDMWIEKAIEYIQ